MNAPTISPPPLRLDSVAPMQPPSLALGPDRAGAATGIDLGRSAFDTARAEDLRATGAVPVPIDPAAGSPTESVTEWSTRSSTASPQDYPDFIDPKVESQIRSFSRGPSGLGSAGRLIESAHRLESQIEAALAKGYPPNHPSIQRANRLVHETLLNAQVVSQNVALQLDATAKVIESATSSLRTVLQTQA